MEQELEKVVQDKQGESASQPPMIAPTVPTILPTTVAVIPPVVPPSTTDIATTDVSVASTQQQQNLA